ncbi:unnamed protein product, partial [Iphiclides podalirius]
MCEVVPRRIDGGRNSEMSATPEVPEVMEDGRGGQYGRGRGGGLLGGGEGASDSPALTQLGRHPARRLSISGVENSARRGGRRKKTLFVFFHRPVHLFHFIAFPLRIYVYFDPRVVV